MDIDQEKQQKIKDRHFKGQYPHEHVIAFFRPHWVTLLPHLLLGLLLAVGIVIFVTNFAHLGFQPAFQSLFLSIMVIGVLLFSYLIHGFYIELFKHFLHTVIITNHRLVDIRKTIFMKDDQDSLLIEVIQDIKKEQEGILKNLLGFGDLSIQMSSSDIKVIRFVPNPNYHFRLLNRIKQEYKPIQIESKESMRTHQQIQQVGFIAPEGVHQVADHNGEWTNRT